MKHILHRLTLCASFVSVALVLTGCGGGARSEEGILSVANEAVSKGDLRGATVHLKDGLQHFPESARLRFSLGKVFLAGGSATDALVELDKARAGGLPLEQVGIDLGRALLANRQYKRVVAEIGEATVPDASLAAEFKALSALAQIELGAVREARRLVEQALVQDPNSVAALMIKARFLAAEGKTEEALVLVSRVLEDRSTFADALILKGDILWSGKADKAGAQAAYRKSVEANPKEVTGHVALIRLALDSKDLIAYGRHLEGLKSFLPQHPETQLRELEFAILKGDASSMRERADALLKIAPSNARVLQLAGTVDMESGAFASAESRFQNALKNSPTLTSARLLLAQTYLRQGSPRKALISIRPLQEAGNETSLRSAMQLAAKAYLLMGDTRKAEEQFAQLAKLNPSDARVQTALALTRISNGHSDEGLGQLAELTRSDQSTTADLALVSARLQRGETAKALDAIKHLESKDPKGAMPKLLRGRVEARSGRLVQARGSFESALALVPNFYPAVEALNALDLAIGKPVDAKLRLEGYLKVRPGEVQATLAHVDVLRRLGGSVESLAAALDAAIMSSPREVDLRVARAEMLLAQHKVKAALAAAQEANEIFPDNAIVLDLVGRAHLAAGEREQGLGVLRTNAARNPTMVEPQMRLAEIFASSNDIAAARASYRLALENAPDALPVVSNWVKLELAGNRFKEAQAVVVEYQRRRPSDPLGLLLEADILTKQKKYGEAAERVQRALKSKQDTELAVRLHSLYLAAGNRSGARDFEKSWLTVHPQDGAFYFHLGWTALARKELAEAEVYYRRVLEFDPKNPAALNNVASIMVELDKPGALHMAEAANSVAPNQPAFMDTLASALAKEKQAERALAVQRDVVARAPAEHGFRLHLAKLLLQAGDRDGAKAELQKLAALGDRFPGSAEVKLLLAQL